MVRILSDTIRISYGIPGMVWTSATLMTPFMLQSVCRYYIVYTWRYCRDGLGYCIIMGTYQVKARYIIYTKVTFCLRSTIWKSWHASSVEAATTTDLRARWYSSCVPMKCDNNYIVWMMHVSYYS